MPKDVKAWGAVSRQDERPMHMPACYTHPASGQALIGLKQHQAPSIIVCG